MCLTCLDSAPKSLDGQQLKNSPETAHNSPETAPNKAVQKCNKLQKPPFLLLS